MSERLCLCWRATAADLSVLFLQSSEALEFMKRDLAEFTQVVQHDTACTIAATASVVKDKLAVSRGGGELGAAGRGERDTATAGTEGTILQTDPEIRTRAVGFRHCPCADPILSPVWDFHVV